MRTFLIASAVTSAVAATASAAPSDTPYVLSAPHADFLMQLEQAAAAPGAVQRTLAGAAGWDAELPRLLDDQTEVVTALVELFAAADWEGERELAQRAERMIWHEVGDVEVLYPAAALVGSIAQARMTAPVPAGGATARGSLYGPGPIPMMGVGSPHAPADRP
jgi:hypothetical protein